MSDGTANGKRGLGEDEGRCSCGVKRTLAADVPRPSRARIARWHRDHRDALGPWARVAADAVVGDANALGTFGVEGTKGTGADWFGREWLGASGRRAGRALSELCRRAA